MATTNTATARSARPASGGTADAETGGRPLRADARRNRARVLEAAQAAFAEQGLAVPLDDIARRAGVGAGTIYRHFPTKESLFEAVVHRRTQALAEYARTLTDADDPGAAFFEFLGRMLDEGTAKKDLVDALSQAGIDVLASGSSASQDMQDAMRTLLERAQRAGAVRGDIDVAELMALLASTLIAVQRLRKDRAMARRVFGILCDGVRAPGRPAPSTG